MRFCYIDYRKLVLRSKSKGKRNAYFNSFYVEIVPEIKLEQFIVIFRKSYFLNLQLFFFSQLFFRVVLDQGGTTLITIKEIRNSMAVKVRLIPIPSDGIQTETNISCKSQINCLNSCL